MYEVVVILNKISHKVSDTLQNFVWLCSNNFFFKVAKYQKSKFYIYFEQVNDRWSYKS